MLDRVETKYCMCVHNNRTSHHVAVCRLCVLSGAEASESLFEHEYPERVT